MTKFKSETILTHSGISVGKYDGTINVPPHRASTMIFDGFEGMKNAKYVYSRSGNPSSDAFEKAITELYGCSGSVSTCSGLSSITVALLALAKPNSHILIMDNVYNHTRTFSEGVLSFMGITAEYYPPMIGKDIEKLIKPETSVIFLEAPGSYTYEVCDIEAITSVAKKHGIKTIIDNTWATPVLLNPFEHGVDAAVMSATKYVGGHSDAMLGVASGTDETYPLLKQAAMKLGNCAGSEELYMGLRGLRTLGVRLKAHGDKSIELAKWLQTRPEIEKVMHPALPDCPGHENWKKYFKGSSGTFSVLLKTQDEAKIEKMVKAFKLFQFGLSWGGFESLCFASKPTRNCAGADVPYYLRLHVGFEDNEDLKQDLINGFSHL